MRPATLNITSLTAFFSRLDALPPVEVDGRLVPVAVVRSARARRAALRVDAVRGEIRLTLPARLALKHAEHLLHDHHQWIADRLRAMPAPQPIAPGRKIPFRGTPLLIDWQPGAARTPILDGERLMLGGPTPSVASRVERWLKAQALDALTADTLHYAEKAGRVVETVRVADPRARWGSCSASGRIAYSWRLILAPDWVRQSVAAHEVAHLVHLNHSPAFHRLNRELLGSDPAPARAWLRKNGSGLYWVGRARPD